MKRSFNILFIFGGLLLLSACDAQVQEYVRQGAAPSQTPTPTPTLTPSGPSFLKMSPGRMTAVSSDSAVMMDATVTPTRRTFSGGGMSADVTMSRSRASVQ